MKQPHQQNVTQLMSDVIKKHEIEKNSETLENLTS